jgi:hypothetical protein
MTCTWTGRLLAAVALIGLMGSTTEAQEIARTFDHLPALLKAGDTVRVTDASGLQFSGRIIQLTPTTIGVLSQGARRDLTEADVLSIVRRNGGDAGRGARWGLAVGAAFGLLLTVPMATDCYECGWQIPLAGAMFAGIGAGVGAGVGASLTTRELVYSRGNAAGTKMAISPIVGRDRTGVRMALRF